MSFLSDPIVIGLMIGLPSALVGYLGYRRSRQVDKISAQSGIASGNAQAISQVIEGLNKIILALQEDKKVDRADIVYLTNQRDALQKELTRMHHKYGDNGHTT